VPIAATCGSNGVGRRRSRLHARAGELVAQEAQALTGHLRVRQDGLDLRELDGRGGEQRVTNAQLRLADDLEVVVVVGQQVERDADRAVEGVLDRRDRPVDLAAAQREDRVVDRRLRDRLDGARLGACQQGLLGERARRPEIADARERSCGHLTQTVRPDRRPLRRPRR
jgi:hypothetical protein